MSWHRAHFLLVWVAVVAVVAAARGAQAQLPADIVHMQIVAHEDDDFLFMNPDLAKQITAGHGTVTVYLTAGQSIGTNPGVTPVLDRWEFARARQLGELAAYAQMAGVTNAWSRSIVAPDGVHSVEVYTLDAAPRIELVFMGLPDGGDTVEPHNEALADMWADPSYVTNTIVPKCATPSIPLPSDCWSSPLPLQYYDRAGVLAVLQALISTHQPMFVRTLDPNPRQGTASIPTYDNPDHIAAARFTDAALASYHGPEPARRYTLLHYLGYPFFHYPENLGSADYLEKRATAQTYRPFDPNYDFFASEYEVYYWRMWQRYSASTTWLERTGDGRLVAVTVGDRQVFAWQESSPGGAWVGPVLVPSATPLAPHLTLLRRPDGRLQLFALRLPLERENWSADPTAPPQQVVTAVQLAAAGVIRFGPWSVVGTPDAGCSGLCQWTGPQAAAIDGAGRTFVFAKDSTGHVAYAHSNGGPWSAFASLGGEDIVDGIAAITRDDGRVEVFATGLSSQLQRFVQLAGTALFSRDIPFSSTFYSAASAPTATKNADGRLEIFYREKDTARALTAYQTLAGSWAGPVVLYGDAGAGPIAALRRSATGQIMLFERNVAAGISATWQQAPNDSFYLQWSILGGYVEEYPSAASDAFGRAVVVVKSGDGRLYFRRESGAIGSFAAWALMACTGGDADADGFCDAVDNCPTVANPLQEDADANGVGDVCECGDVDLSNAVDGADVTRLRGHLALLPPTLTSPGLARCSVIGLAADCDLRDVAVLRRRLATPALPPGISPVCSAANP